jgi:hypothetical protein
MSRISFVLVLPFLAVVGVVAVAQPVPLATLQNSNLFFAAVTLTTNGVPGLTNLAPRLMVSGVSAASAHGGSVSLVNTQVWVRRYNGPGNAFDQALKAAVDREGNVIVTGDSAGQTTDYDFATVKYAGDGTPLWTNRYDGAAHGYDAAWYVAVDDADNVYVTGNSAGSGTANNIVTIGYSGNGTALWTNCYNRSGTNYHQLAGFAVDGAGNVYVLVETFYDMGDYTTLKYDALGNAVWTNHFKASTDSSDYPASVAVDQNGGVFVTGSSTIQMQGSSMVTLKYASDGTGIWTNFFQFPGNQSSGVSAQPAALAVDTSGNAIVTGDLFTDPWQYVTVKYAGDGTPLWTNLLATPIYQGGNVPDVAADLNGNVFVIGGSPGASGAETDFSTTKITSDGIPLWTNRYYDLNNTGNGFLGGVAVDNAGNFYLTGHSTGPGGTNLDYTTVKIAANGAAIWTNRYDGPAQGQDFAMALAVDDAGDVYVTGQSDGGLSGFDYATVKYADYFSYTPPTNFTGTDTFTFTAVDNLGNSATGTVTVAVLPLVLQFNTDPLNLQYTPQGLRLQVDGARGVNPVILYASTNLVDWQPIYTNPPSLGSACFLDSAATNQPKRFYRAMQPP